MRFTLSGMPCYLKGPVDHRCSIDTDRFQQYVDQTGPSDRPRISYVVPVRDDPDGITETVHSLLAADYDPIEVHVIITPTDGTTVAAVEGIEADPLHLSREESYETPGAARNVGLDRCHGDVVVFIDSGMTISDSFPWQVAWVFESESIDYLGYRAEIVGGSTLVSEYDRAVRFPNWGMMIQSGFCPTCALAIDRSIVDDGLRFDPRLSGSEDVEFGHRVLGKGYEWAFCPDIRVTHPARESIREIVSKGLKDGRGWHQLFVHTDETHLRSRSLLLTASAYTPGSLEYISWICDGWEEMPLSRKGLVVGLQYVESLARTCGWVSDIAMSNDNFDS